MWGNINADPSTVGGYNAFNHVPGGSNVLFMDGHVSFLKYPAGGVGGRFPVTGSFARIMAEVMEASLGL